MRWKTACALSWLIAWPPACSYVRAPARAEAEEPPIRAVTYSSEKREMIFQIDRRMNDVVARYTAELDAIRERLVRELEALSPPARLVAVDRTLRGYNAAQVDRYHAAIDRLVQAAVDQTVHLVGQEERLHQEKVVGRVEREVWDIAREVGLGQQGGGYGFVSGVREIDERAAVTIELLQGFADIEGLKDLGAIRKAEVLQLSRDFHHDITLEDLSATAPVLLDRLEQGEGPPIAGRMLLFRSGELESWRTSSQDGEGIVVAFQNERIPLDHELGLVQLVRHRLVRGGMIVRDFGWMPDPQVPGGRGRLPLAEGLADPRFLASECFYPGINQDHSRFPSVRDFQVVYDYKTALVDRTAGAILGAIDWQITWVVSHTGQVRILDSVKPQFDLDVDLIARTLEEGAASLPGRGEPAPGDLLARRRVPLEPPFTPSVRELGGGRQGVIARPVGPDRLRITAEGRRYLMSHRLKILASDVGFFSYLDGTRGRYVLAITDIVPGSVVEDLGFERNDDLHEINGVPIRRFLDLWNYLQAHPREREYRVQVNRNGALRWLTFEVDGVPPRPEDEEPVPDEVLSDAEVERINRLFEG